MNVAEDGPLGPDLIGSGGSAGPERPFLSPVRRRAGDLALGVRLAVAGGRSERLRMTLSAVGVGVGVALLLVATAIPSLLENLSDRRTARDLPGSFFGTGYPGTHGLVATDTTMIVERYMGGFRDIPLMGVLLDPEGTHPPLPPGITTLPGPGEMIVSPALAELLAGRDRPRLVPRLPYRQVGRIGKAGLESPRELFFYAGVELSAELSPEGDTFEVFGPERIDHFGAEPTARIYVLVGTLSLLVVVVLLLPIGMFAAAAAVRFGSEARDRQLAVVRLLGADARTARWIAAGGALAAALLGCAVGVALFAAGCGAVERIGFVGLSFFASDLLPGPAFALPVLLAVPASAVLGMLVALRHVVDEPLGAVRRASIGRRRGRWRLLPALAGPALLLTLPEGIGWEGGPRDYAQLAGGTTLSLLGVAVLSPWLVEAAVRRLNGGPLSWTLAARRLQRGSATTLRTVAVVSITVTGAIALQMLFSAADREYYSDTFREAGLLRVDMPATAKPADGLARALFAAQGVRSVHTYSTSTVTLPPVSDGDFTFGGMTSKMIVGDCPTLRKLAGIADCADGDVFAPLDEPNVVDTRDLADPEQLFEQIADAGCGIPGPGLEVTLGVPGDLRWALPPDTKKVTLRDNGEYWSDVGVLATPAALPADFQSAMATVTGVVRVDPDDPDAEDNVVAAIAGLGRLRTVDGVSAGSDPAPVGLRAAGYVGIVAVFGLVGAGLVAAVAEESRERRRTLAALAAVGARRRTVAVSVLWQTAIPLILGVTLALGAGLGLGAALLRLAGVALSIPWANIAVACATMFAVVLGTTAASLPVLRRMMRPDGLRIE